ncbi:helix-turn-helix domain-containing protein [Burkholderia gladioli]|uniref:helix-turn-helix domain-containing protein n=1 Tax=Burkholderia gladioli TaxID=28095 RepID=UPI00164017D0|nr:helix-turn-helix domain-containing protein [Burkholderia gladioli]
MKSPATFMDRLQRAIEIREGELGHRIMKKDLAKAAKVSSSAVTLWYKGSTEQLKAESLFGLARYLKVRPEWLRDKDGPMRDGSVKADDAAVAEPPTSSAAQAAIDAIREADAAGVPADVFAAIQALIRAIPQERDGDGHEPHMQA